MNEPMNMASPVRVRPAVAADAAALAQLGAATFVETFGHLYQPDDLQGFLRHSRSESYYAGLIGDPRISVQLAFLETEPGPIGYSVAGPCKLPVTDLEATAGELRELYVLARYQQLKIGSRLLSSSLEWLVAQVYSPLYVGVYSDNLGAQRLYGRHGFQKVGEYGFPVGEHIDREFILKR